MNKHIIDLDVQGMSCGSCVKHVTEALECVDGVERVSVDLESGRVSVVGALEESGTALIDVLDAAGYPSRLAGAGPESVRGEVKGGARSGCCCR